MAVPGSVVGVGKLITPGGQVGPKGDAGTAANVPLADITQNGLLRKTSGLTTDFTDGTNNYQDLATAVRPIIWSQTRRVFNAIQNPNFEVDQRVVGAAGAYPAGTMAFFQCDRWNISKSAATGALTAQKQITAAGAVKLPGTNYFLTNSILNLTVSTTQASLAAGEYVIVRQFVEGPQLRELLGDVHSISLLVNSSIALNISVALRSASASHSLTNLVSVPAGVWTLLTLPNLPIWAAGATWNTSPGVLGYYLEICLGAGATFTAPVAGSWQAGAFFAAPGTNNWLVNSGASFSLAFVQHEPGLLCTTPIDKPFAGANGNYEECLRYFQKTYSYGVPPGAVGSPGSRVFWGSNTAVSVVGAGSFHKPMAKAPTMILYDHSNGAANSVMDGGSVHHAGASVGAPSDTGFNTISFTTGLTGMLPVYFQYTADTGW